MSTIVDRYLEAQKNLPPGHYKIERRKEAIDSEYHHSRLLENFWIRKLSKRKVESLRKKMCADTFIYTLCDLLGIKAPKIVFDRTTNFMVSAYYTPPKKEIVFGDNKPNMITVIHELAHHFAHVERIRTSTLPGHLSFLEDEKKIFSLSHGKSFLWTEDFIFQTVKDVM